MKDFHSRETDSDTEDEYSGYEAALYAEYRIRRRVGPSIVVSGDLRNKPNRIQSLTIRCTE